MSDETKTAVDPTAADEPGRALNAGVEEADAPSTPYPTQAQNDAIRTGEATVHDFDEDDGAQRKGRNLNAGRGLGYKTR